MIIILTIEITMIKIAKNSNNNHDNNKMLIEE